MSDPGRDPSPDLPEPQAAPWAESESGSPRVVGVELEMGGIELEEIGLRIRDCAGGELDRISDYELRIRGTRVGDVRIELDASLFRDLKVKGFLKRLHLEEIDPDMADSFERTMATGARRFVPYEVVFDPVEIARLPELDEIAAGFADCAEGTGRALTNAFGLHLNPELPRVDADTVVAYLRAFLCLYEELKLAHRVDTSRALSPFIDPFPKAYARRVMAAEYRPGVERLIDDYAAENPTRNRPLDLLPTLSWMDEARVARLLPEEKIGRRPALHYRLPDCRIDEPGWTITGQWNIWARVERLAADDKALARACEMWLENARGPWRRLSDWLSETVENE